MALAHAHPCEAIDIRPLRGALGDAVTTSLIKTEHLQLMRLVLRAGAGLPEHHVAGEITIQCIEGEAVVVTPSGTCPLAAGQVMLLPASMPHAVRAVTDASLLVTVVLTPH